MGWFNRQSSKRLKVGIGFHPTGLSLAIIDDSQGEPSLRYCQFHTAETPERQHEVLSELIRKQKIQDYPVNVVLDPVFYSLLQVEAPEVEPEEMRSALRWRIKDLIDFHIDDAVIEVFDLPESKRQGINRLMYVAATRVALVRNVIDLVEECDLQLNAIDICELAIRNILATLNDPEKVQALLFLRRSHGSIEIVKNDQLFISRQLSINLDQLEGNGDYSVEETLDTLVLELQRSLDYYESQFGQGPAHGVNILLPGELQSSVVEYADTNLLLPVSPLPLTEYFSGNSELDERQLINNLATIGVAMRSG